MRLLIVIALALGVLAGVARAQTPSERLAEARTKFFEGDHEATIALLSPLLFPSPKFSDPDELNEAQLLMGVALFETGQREAAEEQFDELILSTEGRFELDENLYSAEVRAFYERKRAKMTQQIADEKEKRRIAEERDRARRLRENTQVVEIEHRDYYVNFIPFGAGQFQNGDRGWGRFFFVSEALLGGASLGLFTAQIVKWGFPLKVPTRDKAEAETLQVLQIGTGGVFWVIALTGVIHAMENYEPTRVKTRKLLPGEQPTDYTPVPSSSLHLLPMVGPDRAGLVLSWEF